ncbi:MAG: DUF4197 domain-containing protein [Bacteroidales bacterium]|jgi:hypothetical protein|nr:DUF4197 domain-containing protein [Bacteroidales bacterium]
MKQFFIILLTLFTLSSCELLEDLLEETDNTLSTSEIVQGLKEALEAGTDTASTEMSANNGYYKGSPSLALIQLPDEIATIRTKINSNFLASLASETLGLDDKFDDVILAVNRAAEDAAKEVAPIFKDAIFNLTIADGFDILNGVVPGITNTKSAVTEFDSTAATQYLKIQTFASLTSLYAPKINASLDKDLVSGQSANEIWANLTSTYNTLLSMLTSSTISDLGLPSSINSDLGEFSTQVALDELFYRVGEEEKKIRKDPYQWASSIIQKVFGYVFN